ncbi:hypothetical protein [Seonamhaeicola sp.]|uniref:hypothetical protein n=1 Tax=Seonamhaeicola sp. TaxID=1912245 RepID=UPI00261D7EBB|nr:hypothetical protein [Seonamhaeicola sp.]
MNKSKVLVSLVFVIYLLFAIFGFMGKEAVAFTLNSLIIPSIAIIYFIFFDKKTIFFSLFLICYAASDLIGLIVSLIPYNESFLLVRNIDYYVGNSLYILSYMFLAIEICKSLNVKHILKNFKIHITVLTALNVYLIYVLQLIVDPEQKMPVGKYFLELTYNIVMLLLLSGALLNYFYRDNKKALYLFLGALCIVFSEVIEVAYLYISQRSLLNFISTTLALSAFYFFCKQTALSDVREEEMHVYVESPKSTKA